MESKTKTPETERDRKPNMLKHTKETAVLNGNKKRLYSSSKAKPTEISNSNISQPLYLSSAFTIKNYLALDISPDRIHYILLRQTGSKVKVMKYGMKVIEPQWINNPNILQEKLKQLPRIAKKSSTFITVSYFNTSMQFREIILPKIGKKSDLQNAVYYQIESELRESDKNFEWNYQILEEFRDDDATKLRILVMVVPGNITQNCMTAFRAAGLNPQRLIPRPLVLSAAYNKMIDKPGDDLLLDISINFSQICCFNGGKLRYVRNISGGFEQFDNPIVAHSSGKIIEKEATPPPEMPQSSTNKLSDRLHHILQKKQNQVQDKQRIAFQKFYLEIWRTIEHLDNTRFQRIILSGYGSKIESLAPYLAEHSNLPVFIIAPSYKNMSDDNLLKYGEYFASTGAVLQTRKSSNFIPARYQKLERYRKFNYWLVALFVAGVLLAAYTALFDQGGVKAQQEIIGNFQEEFQQLSVVEKQYDELLGQLEKIRHEKQELQDHVKLFPPVLDVLRLFSNETPPYIQLKKLQIQPFNSEEFGVGQEDDQDVQSEYQYQVLITGEVLNDYFLADITLMDFINHLNDLGVFAMIKLIQKKKDAANKIFEFELVAYL